MDISLSMNLFASYEIEKALAKAREFGYEYVELFDNLFNQKALSTKHMNSLLAKHDLKVSSIATVSVELPLTNDFFAGPDEEKRKKAVENMKSDPVEAACKSIVKTRLCRSGMRWSRPGGQRILHLRCFIKSNRWDEFWKHYIQLRHSA